MSFFGSAAFHAEGVDPTGTARSALFAALLAGGRRQPLGKLDVPVNGLRTGAVESERSKLLFYLLNGKTRMRPSYECFETEPAYASMPFARSFFVFFAKEL